MFRSENVDGDAERLLRSVMNAPALELVADRRARCEHEIVAGIQVPQVSARDGANTRPDALLQHSRQIGMTESDDRDAESLRSSARRETHPVRVACLDEMGSERHERIAPAWDAERKAIAAGEWNGRSAARPHVRESGKRSRDAQRGPDRGGHVGGA